MLNRKAMSPMIVTLLLIALAVALGAMIMNWTAGTTAPVPSGTCEETRIEPQTAFGSELICYDEEENVIRLVVKNSGRTTLSSVVYRRITPDMNMNEIEMPNSRLRPGDIYEGTIEHAGTGGVHLELIPEIMVAGAPALCTGQGIVKESLTPC